MKNVCMFCGGDIHGKIVTVVKEQKGEVIIIEHVPAGVCSQCGEREYEAEVAAKLEIILREKKRARREKLVPVADFAEV
ncbi:MAG: type II toxin-antitoxin system MqsA family antitoxin [Candidatus Omnitrophota bacterium]